MTTPLSSRIREKTPRVAVVVPGFEEGGGVPQVGRFLARAIRSSGRYHADIVSLPMNPRDDASVRFRSPASWVRGTVARPGAWAGEPCVRVGCVGSELEFQRYRARPLLTELLRGYDLVHFVAGAPAWVLASRGVGRPVALQVATLAAAERRSEWETHRSPGAVWRTGMLRITTALENRALRLADLVFVENEWMYEHVSDRIGTDRVVFAPPGVDTARFRPPETDASRRGILAVGRFADPRKNARLLFEAYHKLKNREPNLPDLVLAGHTGPSASDWEHAEELGIRDRIRFYPDVSEEELVGLYQGASVLAVPSHEEGLGLAILEAMACGLPVVSTDCGGPRTSVVPGETGRIVPLGDAEAFAAALHELLDDRARASRMGAAGRARAEAKFSLDATARSFVEGCDFLLGGARE